MSKRLTYCLSGAFSLIAFTVCSQDNQGNQAVVTIVGDAPAQGNNDPNDFINSNPYVENNAPQTNQPLTAQNIEPTLENGFHIRFELNQASQEYNIQKADAAVASGLSSTSTSSSGGGASVGKAKKHGNSRAERNFNTKKKLNSWLPKRKKRYHPHLCGRF
ncbi:hypothetical protein BH10BAC1_BH10BAC1_07320 [soil metagenome]